MKLRSAENIEVKGKRVLLRVAFDVHYKPEGGRFIVEDDARIKSAIPTIQNLIKRGAIVILLTWLQRPGGKVVEELRLAPAGDRLAELLGKPVLCLPDCVGEAVRTVINNAPPGSVLLLENVRFHRGEKGEEGYDDAYARELSRNGDIFINEAFAQSHRDVASISGIPRYLPSYAGPALIQEVEVLNNLLERPKRPFIGIIGGAKISSKIKLITNLLKKVDYLLLGGALANTILKAQGLQIGKSLTDYTVLTAGEQLVLTDTRLKIPVDVVTARSIDAAAETFKRAAGNVGLEEIILDIGSDTVALYKMIINQAKTIVWNGPMGYFEISKFARGTYEIARIIASQSQATSVVGGGETIDAISNLGIKDNFSFVSTGGGAMLEFLEGKTLPGIKPLLEP